VAGGRRMRFMKLLLPVDDEVDNKEEEEEK
jgi:hypothetical protein